MVNVRFILASSVNCVAGSVLSRASVNFVLALAIVALALAALTCVCACVLMSFNVVSSVNCWPNRLSNFALVFVSKSSWLIFKPSCFVVNLPFNLASSVNCVAVSGFARAAVNFVLASSLALAASA